MKRGALGMSTGLEYAPVCAAGTDEIVELACDDNAPMCIFLDQDINIVAALMPHDYMMSSIDDDKLTGKRGVRAEKRPDS